MKLLLLIIFLLFSIDSGAQKTDLNYFLDKAKTNSPLINRSKNESIVADLDLKQIRSILSKPDINIESGILFAPIILKDNNTTRFQVASEGGEKYFGYDLAATDGGQYHAVVSISQQLLTASKYQTYSEMTGLKKKINENNITLTIHETEQLVTYQYLLCQKSKMESINSSSIIKEIEDQLIIMKKLVGNGVFKQTDLLLLQIELSSFQGELKSFQADYINNLFDLCLLCGIGDDTVSDIEDIELQLKSPKVVDSEFLISYTLDSLNIQSALSIEELKYKPEIGVFADAGLNAVYLPSLNRLGFSTGITFKMNLFDGNQKKIMREKTVVDLNSIWFEKNNFITKKDIYKTKILSNLKSLDDRIKINEEQIVQYNSLYEAFNKQLSQGDISVLDFKNLLKDIVAKRHEGLLLKMEKQMLINSYNYWNF